MTYGRPERLAPPHSPAPTVIVEVVQWRWLALLPACAIAFAQPDDEIRKILTARIGDPQKKGMIAATIDGDGHRRVVAVGDVRPDSLFEIGSVTKVFTTLLLADMVERAEVSLDDPVAKYLPEGVRVPGGITLRQLAMHTSGLPRVPTNLSPKTLANPYVEYTPAKLYDFLNTYKLTRAPGEKWEYSNLGAGLLGHALARRAGLDYGTLVRFRIANPLDMTSTYTVLPEWLKSRAVKGHNALGQPVSNWDWDALAGAGALWSGADDMLDFVAANLGQKKSGLAPAMAAMQKGRVSVGGEIGQSLGWHTLTHNGADIFWKDGATFGFSSFIAFDPKTGRGVVVLCDAIGSVADIGFHLLDPSIPLRSE
jgi:serine-type D-Ala-D-Ala carboxypeptidase/endopeptidase